ncbi:MAG: ThuA domain-containing protein [Defluviitaleaceae bacterium]|nr:ThuA domain-containing protein [Defluviitaleaceae bacterium]
MGKINVTVWDETIGPLGPYPNGIYQAIADFLEESKEFGTVRTSTQPQAEHGLSVEVLADTDVLIWWGHCHHNDVDDEIVERVRKRVMEGMGLIVLHSGHASKIFSKLMGTDTLGLRWREADELERVWKIESNHPITIGIPDYFDIPKSEMYGEHFCIPAPDELLFISWHQGGEVFRSGCTFKRGKGKIFYFAPGHETFPIYYMPEVQQVIINAAKWAAPLPMEPVITGHTPESPEAMRLCGQ